MPNTYLQILMAFVTPLLTTTMFIFLYSRLAIVVGLVDRPDARKQHVGEVPLVGGLAIFSSVFLIQLFYLPTPSILLILVLCALMLLVGLIDDHVETPTFVRFVMQIGIASAMVLYGEIEILSIGNLIGFGDVNIGDSFTLVFTVMCVVGVVNAINMIDGVDGLAGSALALSFLALAVMAILSGELQIAILAVAVVGSITAFLYFNSQLFRSNAVVFLGDAGSMAFGLLLVWFFIVLSQGETSLLSPVAAGWFFGYPLADTISVIVRRVSNGRSPLKAGRDHMHHTMLEMGLTATQIMAIVGVIQVLLIVVGFVCSYNRSLESLCFWLFVLLVCLHHFYLPRAIRYFIPAAKSVAD